MFESDRRAELGRVGSTASRSGGWARAACRSKKRIESEPKFVENLKSVLETHTAGDPDEADFLWTDFSPAQLAEMVTDLGTPVSPRVVRDWLADEGLALHKIAKDLAGGSSPDR